MPVEIEPIPGERWLPTPACPDYEVSDHGRVRSLRGPRPKLLTPQQKGARLVVDLFDPERTRHRTSVGRLVLRVFDSEPPDDLAIATHRNGDKHDNRLINLEWLQRDDAINPLSNSFNQGEEWRPTVGYSGYEVSNFGRVLSRRGGTRRLLRLQENHAGYQTVKLRRDGTSYFQRCRVSILVCTAFHGEKPSADHQCAHLDGSRDNNHADNLAWVTVAENASHKERHGTVLRGSAAPNATLSEAKALLIRDLYDEGVMPCIIAKLLKVSQGIAESIGRRTTWAHLTGREMEGFVCYNCNTLKSKK